MIGIERLRTIAGAWDEWGLGGTLTEIADQIELERDAAVADSPYDAILPEDREAIAWVREHGGIDHVKAEWRSRVPRDLYERKRQRLLGHIAECETALGQRRRRIEELGHHVSDLTNENSELRRRAMPEGMEWLIEAWPKFEDDAPVKLGDMALIDGDVDMVEAVQIWIHGKPVIYGDNGSQQLEKGERVKRPAVLAADGEPLDVGQTVWDVESGEELKVEKLCDVGLVQLLTRDGVSRYVYPDQLTHTKPEIDSWQRIEEDALNFVEDNAGIPHDQDQMERDMLAILRRCRALAERERGE